MRIDPVIRAVIESSYLCQRANLVPVAPEDVLYVPRKDVLKVLQQVLGTIQV